jgi:Abnormal spindle-like microcephaly-assoc'd, ASPM-SPD-2-Hydin
MKKRLTAVAASSSVLFVLGLALSAPASAYGGGGGSPTVTSLTADTATPAPNSSGTIKIQLSGVAPRGGSAVTLASSDTSAVSVPASVTIGSGSSSGQFSYTTGAVTSATAVTVTATLGSSSASARLTVTPGGTNGAPLTLTPTSLNFGSQANGTTSAAQTITATNTGTANLFFNNVAESGSFNLDYTIVNDGCIGLTLTPGQSCQTSVTFSPNNTGAMPDSIVFTDNAANSPQTVSMTGTGTGTSTPLSIDDQFFACSGGVCDITDSDPRIVNNFYANSFTAQGGTPPYTWSSSQVPSGMRLHSSGLILGDPTTLGTTTFQVTVTDAAGNTQTGTFSLPTTNSPAPSPGGSCQTYGTLTDSLSGSAINGQTPRGVGTADETKLSGCGGFALLTVQVKNVNLPDGTVLWVTFDGLPVGEINLSRGSGTMPQYNMGDFSVGGFEQVRVYDSLPDQSPFQQILIGGGFS